MNSMFRFQSAVKPGLLGALCVGLIGVYSCTSGNNNASSDKQQGSAEGESVTAVVDTVAEKWVFNTPSEAELQLLKNIPMVTVKGGTFLMGSKDDSNGADLDETPQHNVTVGDFKIAKFELTQDLWKIVMGSNPSRFEGDSLPVEGVSWLDTQVFIEHLNQLTGRQFRLPTEAEWEFAARGGVASKNFKYAGSNKADEVAWYLDNADHSTHAVGLLKPNELGIYDMSGNVFEWCSDWYRNYEDEDEVDPQGPRIGSYRVTRGGGWFAVFRRARCLYRGGGKPEYRSAYQGFRLAE